MFSVDPVRKAEGFSIVAQQKKNKIVVLTHGFQKKTMKTPPGEITRAEKYRQDYLRRIK